MYEKEQFPALFQYDCPAGKEEFQSRDLSKHIKENLFLSIQCQLRFTNATFFKINYLYVEFNPSKMVLRRINYIAQMSIGYRQFFLTFYLPSQSTSSSSNHNKTPHTKKVFSSKERFSIILTHEVDSSILLKTIAPS